MPNYKIFIAEDDNDINELLCDHLTLKGYSVTSTINGREASEIILSEDFDLYLLDWMLPDLSGIQICELIRSNSKTKMKPILFLTAKSDQESIIKGLDSGANDYIKKPFNLAELTARIKANLRINDSCEVLSYKELKVNLESYEVTIQDSPIKLTKSEFILLKSLLASPNHVFTRENLVKFVQGDNTIVTNRTVDTHMTGLRKKIQEYSKNIVTIRGIGYKFEV